MNPEGNESWPSIPEEFAKPAAEYHNTSPSERSAISKQMLGDRYNMTKPNILNEGDQRIRKHLDADLNEFYPAPIVSNKPPIIQKYYNSNDKKTRTPSP